MAITLGAIVLDAADLETESRFWQRLLGGSVVKKERHHIVESDGAPIVAVQLAPEHVPPDWPTGQPQQMHLDLAVDDIAEAHRQAVEAGARVLESTIDDAAPSGYRVFADPAGHPFCLCWGD